MKVYLLYFILAVFAIAVMLVFGVLGYTIWSQRAYRKTALPELITDEELELEDSVSAFALEVLEEDPDAITEAYTDQVHDGYAFKMVEESVEELEDDGFSLPSLDEIPEEAANDGIMGEDLPELTLDELPVPEELTMGDSLSPTDELTATITTEEEPVYQPPMILSDDDDDDDDLASQFAQEYTDEVTAQKNNESNFASVVNNTPPTFKLNFDEDDAQDDLAALNEDFGTIKTTDVKVDDQPVLYRGKRLSVTPVDTNSDH